MIPNQPLKLERADVETCESKCRRVFSWILQLLVWASIAFMLYAHLKKAEGFDEEWDVKVMKVFSYIALPLFYLIYVILELCSSTFEYLLNMKASVSIHEYMRSLFQTPITVTFNVECYHEKYVLVNGTFRKEKVVTYTGSRNFRYFSWRDTSGLFFLDSSEAIKNDKISYIKLQLNPVYKLYDADTQADFNSQSAAFYAENKWRDEEMRTFETHSINGLDEFNLVKIKENEPPLFNGFWFFFFTLLTLSQFYKYYIASFTSYQYFEVRKEISSRVNIRSSDFDEHYRVDCPRIVLNGVETKFDAPPGGMDYQTEVPISINQIPTQYANSQNKDINSNFPNEIEVQNYNEGFLTNKEK